MGTYAYDATNNTLDLIAGRGNTSSSANKTDLTAIILTGTTNTSGNVISAGTWFYLNGTPCIAKVDIASGATFTEGTNYEEKTIGSALSELNSNYTLVYSYTSDGTKTWRQLFNIMANDISGLLNNVGSNCPDYKVVVDVDTVSGGGYPAILSKALANWYTCTVNNGDKLQIIQAIFHGNYSGIQIVNISASTTYSITNLEDVIIPSGRVVKVYKVGTFS